MNKQELIAKIVKDTGLTKVSATGAVESLLDGIKKSLKKGNAVTFVGFGSFQTSMRKARTARNPQTGATVKVPEAARRPLQGRQGPQGLGQLSLLNGAWPRRHTGLPAFGLGFRRAGRPVRTAHGGSLSVRRRTRASSPSGVPAAIRDAGRVAPARGGAQEACRAAPGFPTRPWLPGGPNLPVRVDSTKSRAGILAVRAVGQGRAIGA